MSSQPARSVTTSSMVPHGTVQRSHSLCCDLMQCVSMMQTLRRMQCSTRTSFLPPLRKGGKNRQNFLSRYSETSLLWSNRDERFECGERLVADARHFLEIIDGFEWTMFLTILGNGLRLGRPNTL